MRLFSLDRFCFCSFVNFDDCRVLLGSIGRRSVPCGMPIQTYTTVAFSLLSWDLDATFCQVSLRCFAKMEGGEKKTNGLNGTGQTAFDFAYEWIYFHFRTNIIPTCTVAYLIVHHSFDHLIDSRSNQERVLPTIFFIFFRYQLIWYTSVGTLSK